MALTEKEARGAYRSSWSWALDVENLPRTRDFLSMFKVEAADGSLPRFNLNVIQEQIDAVIQRLEDEGKPVRIIILKPRQVGCSTLIDGRLFERVVRVPGQKCLVMADDEENSQELYESKIRHLWRQIPKSVRPMEERSNRRELVIRHGEGPLDKDTPERHRRRGRSFVRMMTAGKKEAGRSRTNQHLHLCLHPDTWVLTSDGRAKRLKDVIIGDKVITHNGHMATVKDIVVNRTEDVSPGKRMMRVRTWLGSAVSMTPEHQIFTRRGWVRAGDLLLTDYLCMPRRAISQRRTSLLPPVSRTRGRHPKGERKYAGLTEEFGFFVGYYLAEGTIVFNTYKRKKHPAAIVLSHGDTEDAYAERCARAARDWVTSVRRYRQQNSKTVTHTLYGAALASLIEHQFGAKDEKHIPDWVFGAGKPFARGLVAGYFSGDGSKTSGGGNGPETIYATSIRSSLCFQVRDLVCALYGAWGAVDFKPGGVRFGRKEQDAWTLRLHGNAARQVREMIGLPVRGSNAPHVEKSMTDTDHVWLKIREIKEDPDPPEHVIDLEVDHEDHSFRTAHFAVSNSELAFWRNAKEVLAALLQTVHDFPGTSVVIESTANGARGEFYERWRAAVEGRSEYVPLFFAWFDFPEYERPFVDAASRRKFEETMDDEEKEIRSRFGLSLEKLNWRRFTIWNRLGGDKVTYCQEFPATPEEAFVASGTLRFDRRALMRLEMRAPNPIGSGRVLPKAGEGFRFVEDERHPEVVLYRQPEKGREYILAADPAYGVDQGEPYSAPGDFSAAVVRDRRSRRLMARIHLRTEVFRFAMMTYRLGRMFNDALLVPERNAAGITMIQHLREMEYPRLYWEESPEKIMRPFADRIGFLTTERTREAAIEHLAREIALERHELSLEQIRECREFVRKDSGKWEAREGAHDDEVMADAILAAVNFQIRFEPGDSRIEEVKSRPDRRIAEIDRHVASRLRSGWTGGADVDPTLGSEW